MLEGFDLLVRRESLYCHQCREVKPHDVFSRTFLDYGGGVAPDHRLLARCCSCGNSLVLFALFGLVIGVLFALACRLPHRSPEGDCESSTRGIARKKA